MVRRAVLPLLCLVVALAVFAAGSAGRLLVASAAVLFVPGYLVWSLADAELRLSRLAAPALWLGLSLSAIPLMFLWSNTLGLHLTASVLRLVAVGLVLLAFTVWRRAPGARPVPRALLVSWLFLLGLVGLTRLLAIRGVVLPLWVDSLHHTLLVRIVMERGQIPVSLVPYMPVDPLPYHWGYHTVVATIAGVAALPAATAVLWAGQVLNTLVALAMYGLGTYLLRSPRAGLVAGGVTGLVSLLPGYFVTWGRYTQLTGLLLLPAAMIVAVALIERGGGWWPLAGLGAVLVAGLLLVHYQVFTLYAVFLVVYAAVVVLRQPRRVGAVIGRLALMGAGAGLLTAPWLVVVSRSVLSQVVARPGVLAGSADYNAVDRGLLLAGNNELLFGLAALGTLLALIAGRWRAVAVALWIGAMVLLANPSIVGLPASWFVINQTIIISLFVPLGILVAAGVDEGLRRLRRWASPPIRPVVGVAATGALAVAALFGAWQLSALPIPGAEAVNRWLTPMVNPVTVLATPADLLALDWAAQHTPPDARFLVNSRHWLNGSPRGTDAGWWLLPLAGRWVTTPPAMYVYGTPEYKNDVEALNQRIEALQPGDQAALEQLVRDEQITHVFIGRQGGPIKADLMWGNPHFKPVYDHDGVTIFAVQPGA